MPNQRKGSLEFNFDLDFDFRASLIGTSEGSFSSPGMSVAELGSIAEPKGWWLCSKIGAEVGDIFTALS